MMKMSIKDTKMHLYMQESYAIGKDYRALENALDIINKYQKIEKIIADWKNDGGAFEMSESYWLQSISEVIDQADKEQRINGK